MSTGRTWRAALPLLRASIACASMIGAPSAETIVAATLRGPAADDLHAAIEASDRNDLKTAEREILAAIDDPGFATLDDSSRHFAFELAVEILRRANEPAKAQRFAVLATQGPDQNLDDWKSRLALDLQSKLVRDQAECVTILERNWGGMPGIVSDETVLHVFADTAHRGFEDVRRPMLEALYERRWHPTHTATASALWLELTRLLLESNDSGRAREVAILVDDPADIIVMRADRRFDPIVHSDFVHSNPQRAARDRIKQMQDEVQRAPRSLEPLERLLAIMVTDRMDAEVIERTDEVDHRIQQAGDGAALFDDFQKNYEWILWERSHALRHLGRYDEAVASLRRATAFPAPADTVSQPINLGDLLSALGRAPEVPALLPDSNRLSSHGAMAMFWLRLAVATAEHSEADATLALDYLREHRADAPGVFQSGLMVAGRLDEAENWLIERLKDPYMRKAALLEVQHYAMPRLTAWEEQQHQLVESLHQRASVLAAVKSVGSIGNYPWRYAGID